MKFKILSVLCVFALLLSGCSSSDTPPKEEPGVSKKTEVAEKVLYEKNEIKITVTGIDMEGLFGPALKLLVENNGAKSIAVQTRNNSINGFMINALMSTTVAAGKKASDTLIFYSTDLEAAGIEYIKDIQFNFEVFNPDTYETIDTSGVISITTSIDPSLVKTKVFEGKEILNKDGIRILVQRLVVEGSFMGSEIFLYIENNSKQNIIVQVDDTSVNGFMVSALFSSSVLIGKKIIDGITILDSDLEKNGIKTIDSFEFKFQISKMETFGTIFNSNVITIDF